jgi:hypothetical protein
VDGSGEENIGYVPPSAFGWSVVVIRVVVITVGTFPVPSLEVEKVFGVGGKLNVGIVGIGFFILNDKDVIVAAGVGLSIVVGVEGAVGIGSCFFIRRERERAIEKLYAN